MFSLQFYISFQSSDGSNKNHKDIGVFEMEKQVRMSDELFCNFYAPQPGTKNKFKLFINKFFLFPPKLLF